MSAFLDDQKWLIELIKTTPTTITALTVGEWAEAKRILPPGTTSQPGPFRWTVAPYMREIADCMSETSPVERIAVMKSAQVTYTVGVLENALGYIIDAAPGPTMFVSSDESMAQTAIELRVDRMIETAGLSDRIGSQSTKRHSKKTGDTKGKKEFPGGYLIAVGPNSASKLASFSIQYILGDEIDRWPQNVGSGNKKQSEGDPVYLLERRTAAFEGRRKILYGSTPVEAGRSRIQRLYLEGDQRLYHVPCRHCGEMQPLIWENLKWQHSEETGLDADSVHYECRKCAGKWTNDDKSWFLPRGQWIPQTRPVKHSYRSYHINALYSPLGMTSWPDAAFEFLRRKDNPADFQTFYNTYLGLPWEARHSAPQYERIMLYRESYATNSLPKDAQPLVVTIGADVQKDRIECEIVAWCTSKVSWSIDYRVFNGDTTDPNSAAYTGLRYTLEEQHCGLPVSMALIDSGYNTPEIYNFTSQYYAGVHPSMGSGRPGRDRSVFHRVTVQDHVGLERIDLNVDVLKQEFYGYLTRVKNPEDADPPGYCHFPSAYNEDYFRQLTAEERVKEITRLGTERYIWRKIRDRNEAHDCRIYAMGALYVYASDVMKKHNRDQIDWKEFWQFLKT